MRITNTLFLMALLASCGKHNEKTLVEPISPNENIEQASEITVPASFTRADFDWGNNTLTLQTYVKDEYPETALLSLQPGDRFLFDGDTLTVETVAFDGDEVLVNKGIEEGGATLIKEENNLYRGLLWDDHATYTQKACVTLPLATDWTLNDCGENPSDPTIEVTTDHEHYLNQLPDYNESFSPLNTLVTLRQGKIVRITRRWIP